MCIGMKLYQCIKTMSREDLYKLPLIKVQELHRAYDAIIVSIEYVCGGPHNVGANGEYWSAVSRRNMCRQVFNDRVQKGEVIYGQ